MQDKQTNHFEVLLKGADFMKRRDFIKQTGIAAIFTAFPLKLAVPGQKPLERKGAPKRALSRGGQGCAGVWHVT